MQLDLLLAKFLPDSYRGSFSRFTRKTKYQIQSQPHAIFLNRHAKLIGKKYIIYTFDSRSKPRKALKQTFVLAKPLKLQRHVTRAQKYIPP